MTKKTYYKILKKYQDLTEIRDYNSDYFGLQEELYTCKRQLVKQLEQMLLLMDSRMISGKEMGRNREIVRFHLRCEKLLLQIKEEQLVTERDYKRTFFKDLILFCIFEGESRIHLII